MFCWGLPQLLLGLAPAGALPQPEVPEPPPPLLEGGGPQPLVPLLRALVSPGRGAPPRRPRPGQGSRQPPRLAVGGIGLQAERLDMAVSLVW